MVTSSLPSTEEVPDDQTVGKPGFGESLIPIWGSGREAIYNFQKGNIGWGIFYGVLAVTDVFLVKSLVTAVGKGVIKGGGKLIAKEGAEVIAKEGTEVAAEQGAKVVAKEGSEVILKEGSETVAKETTEQAIKYASPSTLGTLVGTSTSQMRRAAAKKIAETEGHPLKFLLDKMGKFKSSKGLTHAELINMPDVVEMGHITSKLSGGTERIMLQAAWENQFSRVTVEGIGKDAFIENVAIDIGGIAVDLKSAIWWEKLGLLAKGTVANAPRLVF